MTLYSIKLGKTEKLWPHKAEGVFWTEPVTVEIEDGDEDMLKRYLEDVMGDHPEYTRASIDILHRA